VSYQAVIFDLGGVVLGSPLHAIARFERDCGIPEGFINRVVIESGSGGAWAQLERGQLSIEEFSCAFEGDCEAAGCAISAQALMERIAEASQPRPAMLEAIHGIRARGIVAAALTNNWGGEGDGTRALKPHFDVFVESSVVGLRKPDPRIYQHACEAIGIEPERAIFLDDIGRNLKTARQLGMTTIKVTEPDAALAELEATLGFSVRDG
jgi:epoxide hydrolase-like predicted phosphatase